MGINTLYSVLIKNLLILTKLCRVSHKKRRPKHKVHFYKNLSQAFQKKLFPKLAFALLDLNPFGNL